MIERHTRNIVEFALRIPAIIEDADGNASLAGSNSQRFVLATQSRVERHDFAFHVSDQIELQPLKCITIELDAHDFLQRNSVRLQQERETTVARAKIEHV